MRGVIAAFLTACVLSVYGCGVFRPLRENLAVFQEKADQAEFDAWANSMRGANIIETAMNMSAWAQANMVYKPDGVIDYPRDYLVTFKLRSGDCDDFSSMFMAALMRNGSTGDARLMSVRKPGSGHAVCAFRAENGLLYHISNWPGLRGGYETYKELASTVYQDWVYYQVVDFDMQLLEKEGSLF